MGREIVRRSGVSGVGWSYGEGIDGKVWQVGWNGEVLLIAYGWFQYCSRIR